MTLRKMQFVPVRPSVQSMAQDMEHVLRLNDHKGGWEEMDYLEILHRLDDERVELDLVVAKVIEGETEERLEAVIHEACDLANFAMFAAAKARKAIDNLGVKRDG